MTNKSLGTQESWDDYKAVQRRLKETREPQATISDLLAVCKDLVTTCDAQAYTVGLTDEVWVALEAARAVIAKAEGE